MFELKALSLEAVPAAQDKAVRYRLLNEPRLAESICKDILAVDPANRDAIVTLILALSDQFGGGGTGRMKEALELIDGLEDEFERLYYRGIVYERRAKAHLGGRSLATGYVAYEWFMKAMTCYDEAEAMSPPGNDDALLRWNTCARIINEHPHIRPAPRERQEAMLE